jgi:hypothetical protein
MRRDPRPMFLKNTTTHRREARQILMNRDDKSKAKMQVNTHPNIEGKAIFFPERSHSMKRLSH